jgi:hypothetical protein
VPRALLYDNLKTAVLERQGDLIRFHPRLLELDPRRKVADWERRAFRKRRGDDFVDIVGNVAGFPSS